MRALNVTETQHVAGGCGPGMFDGLLEGLVFMFGAGVAGAFVLGIASVLAYQTIHEYYSA